MVARQKKDLKNFSMDEVEPRGPVSPEAAGNVATQYVDSSGNLLNPPATITTTPEIEEVDDAEEKSAHNPIHWLPFGVTSFAEIEQFEDARDAAFEVAEKSNLFPQLVENIMADENITDKSAAVSKISAEFGKFVQAKMDRVGKSDHDDDDTKQANPTEESSWLTRTDRKIDKAIGRFATKLSDAFSLNGKNTNLHSDENGGLVIWKQGDQFRFLAIYSNNYRDIETEIISAKSHERFVDLVDKGIFPMPVLRHFHVEGTDWGQAEMVHYDKDTGFAIAAGYVLPGHEHEAEAIQKMDDVALSHGMPKESVKRDPADPLVYIEHQTIEISDLPLEDAANKLTNFHIIKEAEMGLPANKKAYLREVGVKDIDGLEKNLAKGKTLAQSLNLDSKQDDSDGRGKGTAPVETSPPEVAPPAEVPPVEAPPAESPPAEVAPADPVPPTEAPAVTPEAAPPTEVTPAEPVEPTATPAADPAEAPAEASPPNGASPKAAGSFSEAQTKELTDALTAITSHLLTEIDARLDAKLDKRLAPVTEQLSTSQQKSDEFEKTILGETPLAALQDFIINKEFLNDQSALTSPSASLNALDEKLADESGPAEVMPKEAIINSGNPFTDNIAREIVGQEWMHDLKVPKIPAKTPATALA